MQNLLKNTRYSPSLSANYQRTELAHENIDVVTGRAGLNLSSPQRIGFLTISPAMSASLLSTKYDQSRQAHDRTTYQTLPPDTIITHYTAFDSTRTTNDFSWNFGGNTTTNFYGTFYPHIGRLRGIRHAMTPSATYQFTPAHNGGVRQQTVGLGLRNALDLKVAGNDTTKTGEEDVHKLSGVVIWSLTTQYRPDVPVAKAWSNISSGMNFNLFGLNLSLNHSIDPYKLDVLNTSATSQFHFGGSHPFGRTQKLEVQELNTVAASDTSKRDQSGSGVAYTQRDQYGQETKKSRSDLELKEGRLPWNLNLGLSYSKNQSGQSSSTLRVGWDIQLTDNWRIDYSTIYDVESRGLDGQNFGITRDLHCWEMSFSRQVLGTGLQQEWQYYFRITLKAHPDLYGESGTRGLGTGLMGQF
jgi:hypothetical protein